VIGAGSVQIEEVLLALKIAFLVLLYLFIWRIVRLARREVQEPQLAADDSMLLTPEQARELRLAAAKKIGHLVVVQSPALDRESEVPLSSEPLTVGRDGENDVPLPGDTFASATHARFEPRGDGVWLEDVGSTNGTYVNGVKLKRPKRLEPGDIVKIGESDFRFER
jgi:Na+-transporting methylmalonyl-CoA/oxaloacetate decarboxylase gamma subunit